MSFPPEQHPPFTEAMSTLRPTRQARQPASSSALNAGDFIDRALSRADFRAFLSAGDAEGLGLACQPMPDYAGRGDGALLGLEDELPEWPLPPPACRPAHSAALPSRADIRVGLIAGPGPRPSIGSWSLPSGRHRSGAGKPSAAADGGRVGLIPAVPGLDSDTSSWTPAARAEAKAATVWVWSRRPQPQASADRP